MFAALDGAHTRLSLSLKTYAPEAGHGENVGSNLIISIRIRS
ncbi:MAG TPA: hypothetical protein VJM79_03100 [Rhizorhapis sp.]|nr:hypothetical protein [Rhizorhapis sp.]